LKIALNGGSTVAQYCSIADTYFEVGQECGKRAPRGDCEWRFILRVAVRRPPPTFGQAAAWIESRVKQKAKMRECINETQ